MATKPEFIQLFEKETGIPLKQVPFEEFSKKEIRGNLHTNRNYSLDTKNNLIALSIIYLNFFGKICHGKIWKQ